MVQNQAREQLSAATSELDVLRLTLEEVRARNDKLERSHSHLKKQKTQLLADLQVGCLLHSMAVAEKLIALQHL